GTLRTFCRDAIVGDRKVAAVDRDIPATIQIDPVGAGSLLIIVRHLEARLANENAVASIEMKIPELRIFKRDALNRYAARTFDQRQAGARNAHIGKIPRVRGGGAQLPEQIPDRPARSVECPFSGDAQAVTVFSVDQGRIELFFEMTFDPRTLDRKVGHVRWALQDRIF